MNGTYGFLLLNCNGNCASTYYSLCYSTEGGEGGCLKAPLYRLIVLNGSMVFILYIVPMFGVPIEWGNKMGIRNGRKMVKRRQIRSIP